MKAATVTELKKELQHLDPKELAELCLRMAKYKKENKELLSYLLFNADDEAGYIEKVKSEVDEQFAEINKSHVYFAKKNLRKILRFTNKYIKYSSQKQTEVELLIHFCIRMKNSGISYQRDASLVNLYARQKQKIEKAISKLHEDLQFDYSEEFKAL
jgi:hypothetical protein